MPTRELKVSIVGDSKSLERALTKSSAATTAFGRNVDTTRGKLDKAAGGLTGLQKSFAGGIAAGAIVAGLRQSADAASDQNEEISKSKVIFGSSAKAIEDWSKTTAKAFGISRTEALRAAGTFGALFSGAGRQTAEDAAKLSKVVVNLAGDLASFNNTSTDDALQALRSGLSGEIEPLHRFQVFLTEASVAQRAMTDTGKESATQLTQGERILARYSLILEQTKRAQGDAARTSGELAGQQRILAAQSADLEAKLGKGLLPVMTELVTVTNQYIGVLGKTGVTAGGLGKTLAGVFAVTPGLQLMIGETALLLKLFGDGTKKAQDFSAALAIVAPGEGHLGGTKLGTPPKTPITKALTFSAEQRNRFFDDALSRSLDRVQDSDLKAQVSNLRAIEATIQKRIDATRDITRKLNLEDELVGVRRQRKGVEQQIADVLSQKIKDAKAANIEAKAKELERIQSRQFRALGFDAQGGELTPSAANLRKQLASLQERLASSFADTGVDVTLSSKLKSQFEGARKVLSGQLGDATKEARQKIQELFATIRGEFDKGAKGPLDKIAGLDTKKLLAGITGLSPAAERELRGRLSHFNSAGIALAGAGAGTHRGLGGGIRSGGTMGTILVENTIMLDGQKVAMNTAKHLARKRQINVVQRRGPNAGIQRW